MLGAVRKMTEIVKGNEPAVESRGFQEILRNHLNMFVSKTSTQRLFSDPEESVGDSRQQQLGGQQQLVGLSREQVVASGCGVRMSV
jgi:hypothetical protein